MQTEMMTRLLKNEKIVGYKWTLPIKEAKQIVNLKPIKGISETFDFLKKGLINLYSPNLNDWYLTFGFWKKTTENIEPNSFELGIKVNNSWLFEGDVIEWKYGKDYDINKDEYTNIIIAQAVIEYDDHSHEFILNQIKGEDRNGAGNSFYNPEGRNYWVWSDFKLIGNIHDEQVINEVKK